MVAGARRKRARRLPCQHCPAAGGTARNAPPELSRHVLHRMRATCERDRYARARSQSAADRSQGQLDGPLQFLPVLRGPQLDGDRNRPCRRCDQAFGMALGPVESTSRAQNGQPAFCHRHERTDYLASPQAAVPTCGPILRCPHDPGRSDQDAHPRNMKITRAKGHRRGKRPKFKARQETHLVSLFDSGE